jgi:hypothetical protein
VGVWLADAFEAGQVRRASHLPLGLRRRLDPIERARAKATLARIVTCAGERERLVGDADLYAEHARLERERSGESPFPFLSAVGPCGAPGVFRVPARDVRAFCREAPESWTALGRLLDAWCSAPLSARRELVGDFVALVASVGAAAAGRRRPGAAEEERMDVLLRALDGRAPAASTDAEVAAALCRAYLLGMRAGACDSEAQIEGADA